jgi:hypothetical protein
LTKAMFIYFKDTFLKRFFAFLSAILGKFGTQFWQSVKKYEVFRILYTQIIHITTFVLSVYIIVEFYKFFNVLKIDQQFCAVPQKSCKTH